MQGLAAGMLALGLASAPVCASSQTCRMALTLGLDVSSSVDAGEYHIQLEGLARAFEDPIVQSAIFLVPDAQVALQVFEWSGERHQSVIIDWRLIRASAELDAMAAVLRAHRRSTSDGQTALGEALRFALNQFARAPTCGARKIDISGDGQSNVGIKPQDLDMPTNFTSITVNALAIEASVASLSTYFRNFVIRGPGAFVVQIGDYADYTEAIRDKLVRELTYAQLALLTPD